MSQTDAILATGDHDARILADFFVPGVARPKGNLRRTRNGKMYYPGEASEWFDAMARVARLMYHGIPLSGPLRVVCEFRFDRPASHGTNRDGITIASKRRRKVRDLPPCVSQRLGDIDKLSRGVLDALKAGGVVFDDSHVTELTATKRYCTAGESPGVAVRVEATT